MQDANVDDVSLTQQLNMLDDVVRIHASVYHGF